MRNVMVAPLFASAVNAQSTMTYLNLMWTAPPTLTLVSSDATATTYEKQCPTTTAATSASFKTGSTSAWDFSSISSDFFDFPSSLRDPEDIASYCSSFFANPTVQAYYSTHVPATTPTTEAVSCVPFTMFQGPETWGLQVTLSEPGLLTKNGNCTWSGAFTEVPITCDGEVKGTMWGTEIPSGRMTVIAQSELRSWHGSVGQFAIATVVMATPTAVAGATTQSSGLAAGVPRPTELIAIAGSAAVIAAAAWVL